MRLTTQIKIIMKEYSSILQTAISFIPLIFGANKKAATR